MKNEFLYCEKYRPETIADCILPDDIKSIFQSLRDKGEVINLLLSGPAGTGKTTSAIALCKELNCTYIIINGSETRGIDMVREQVTSFASSMSTDGKTKVIILDEADYITPEAQAALRNLIETFSKNCRFIFTCNFKNKMIPALQSRCSNIEFKFEKKDHAKLQIEMAKRVLQILEKEKVEYNQKSVLELVRQFFPDNRRILNELQRYVNVNGKIDPGLFTIIKGSDIENYITFMKNKDFRSCRQFIAENNDPEFIFENLYENVTKYVTPDSIPIVILTLGEYQYRSSFVANQEINLAAFTVELIKSVKWK